MNKTAGKIIVVAPDSYKGSLSAQSAADSIARGLLRALPSCIIRSYPMADGGEGTLRALLRGGGVVIVSPYGTLRALGVPSQLDC